MEDKASTIVTPEPESPAATKQRRKIPGNLPYTSTPGNVTKTLDQIPLAERPSPFSPDFLHTVIRITGGSARPIIPILKSIGFLDSSGSPSELYDQFRADGTRANAALAGLKRGYAELFKRNQFIHKADEKSLTDLITVVTGLKPSDPIVGQIKSTFKAIQRYALGAIGSSEEQPIAYFPQESTRQTEAHNLANAILTPSENSNKTIGLVYNINIVLPETTSIDVYNAIFRSLKSNLIL